MSFTKLPYRPQTRELMDKFLGYDLRPDAPEGSFVDMRNLSSDLFPKLSPRKGRSTALNIMGDTTGIIMKDKLCFTCGTAFYHGDTRIEMGLSAERKQLVSMGAYVLIFPDRKYINTADHNDRGDIDATYSTNGEVTVHICRPNGEDYTAEYISDTEPENPADKGVWVNTSEYPNTLHQWNEAAGRWVSVTSSCIKLYTNSVGDVCMGDLFNVGDGVVISGIKGSSDVVDFQTGEPLTEKQREQLDALDGSAVILDKGDNWIVISGIMDVKVTIASVVTIRREMPIMDYVVEHGNRLWGCRYGLDAAGEFVNILYASKLGDFRNWTVYRGIDTDSYYANVGTDGPFTGAIAWSYGDRVLFFKEGGYHAVTGNGPGSFRVDWTACDGVQKGSGMSLCELGGVVYYKSRAGVCALAGAPPEEIGGAFGGTRYHDACGGSFLHKYYLSMADRNGDYHLFAYDTRRGLWHREDDTQAVGWADCGDDAWMLLPGGSRHSITGAGGAKELKVKWTAQTGILGAEHPDRKYLTRINVRMKLERGSRLRLLIRYDSAGSWVQVCNVASALLRAYDFPIRIRRCDHYELRFEGEGPGEVQSIVKTYQTGSDRK